MEESRFKSCYVKSAILFMTNPSNQETNLYLFWSTGFFAPELTQWKYINVLAKLKCIFSAMLVNFFFIYVNALYITNT